MPTTANFKNLIQYTSLVAATTAKNIAEAAKVPFLGSTVALSLSILKCIETTGLNKDKYVEIMEQIHEILCSIVQLHSSSEMKGVLPTALLCDIAKFTETLEKLFTILNGQQKGTLGKIKGIFKQPEAAERLQTCKQELGRIVELFKVLGLQNLWKAEFRDSPGVLQSTPRYIVTNPNYIEAFQVHSGEKKIEAEHTTIMKLASGLLTLSTASNSGF
ncbi:hypothetical protein C8J57DRAFT_1235144 [Mycena rebaudengoi]|nr:hypothetical protein C8J57DRAFT_1235144 [Mycena rebaudengoi]